MVLARLEWRMLRSDGAVLQIEARPSVATCDEAREPDHTFAPRAPTTFYR